MDKLTHFDDSGNAHMVDVGSKPITARVAIAEGHIRMGAHARAAIVDRTAKKGDVLAIAQLAGIQAAKRTSDLIPLCHPLPISAVDVQVSSTDEGVRVRATVRTDWRTGVEMEA
ncbi:MAG: cyclic pyranopterin monophosphate synthase MoaC, partial [Myxococcota bacterium]